jgi:hypothetical protein
VATPGDRKERMVYLSTGPLIEIRFMTSGKTGQYLLKYDGGCSRMSKSLSFAVIYCELGTARNCSGYCWCKKFFKRANLRRVTQVEC